MDPDHDRPEGDIRTFLIADIRGYTAFTQAHGDEAAAELAARFASIVEEAVTPLGGRLIELRGDEALTVFGSSRQAIRAAIGLQVRLRPTSGEVFPRGVGVGIDVGEAVAVGDGYRGAALNRAARLCSAAGPGQILATESVVHLAGPLDEAGYRPRKAVAAKGFSGALTAQEVVPRRALAPVPRVERGTSVKSEGMVWRLVALTATFAVAATAAFVLLRDERGESRIEPDSTASVDRAGKIVWNSPPTGRPGGVAAAFGDVWTTDEDRRMLHRIDGETGDAIDRISLDERPGSVAAGAGAIWVSFPGSGSVGRIDPEIGEVSETIRIGNGASALAYGFDSLWVLNALDGTVSQVDADGEVVRTVSLGALPTGIAVGQGAVWVTSEPSGAVIRVDPASGRVIQSTPIGNGPTAVAVGGGYVWVATTPEKTVSRLDPDSGEIQKVPLRAEPHAVAFAHGDLWVAEREGGILSAIDPAEARVADEFRTASAPVALVASEDGIYVAAGARPAGLRGGTLRVLYPDGAIDSIDPGVAFGAASFQLLGVVHDGLVGFRKVGGTAGNEVVADLATAVPSPQDGGRSYTFRLREGIRYSDGAEVQPEDFRRALERVARAAHALYGGPTYSRVVGIDECSAKECDLSEGVEIDEAARTITYHIPEPNPNFLMELALSSAPVPAGTPEIDLRSPFDRQDHFLVAGTGPYMFESVTDDEAVLVRNPHFEEWSEDAQPDGFVDRIEVKIGVAPDEQIQEIEAGRADLMDTVDPALRSGLLERSAQDVHVFPTTVVRYLFLNTTRPPFDDARARRAVNYAIDRARYVDPGVSSAQCQIIPPNFPGYAPYCPYTKGETTSGVWSAPDLRRAKGLIGLSGTRGMVVRVMAPDSPPLSEDARVLAQLLRRLGYGVDLSLSTDDETYFEISGKRSSGLHAGVLGWQPAFPTSADIFKPLLSCEAKKAYEANQPFNFNQTGFCDPAIDRRIEEASELQVSDPSAANAIWQEIDRALMDASPLVPLVLLNGTDFTSDRVGNYQRNAQYGILLSRIWLR